MTKNFVNISHLKKEIRAQVKRLGLEFERPSYMVKLTPTLKSFTFHSRDDNVPLARENNIHSYH